MDDGVRRLDGCGRTADFGLRAYSPHPWRLSSRHVRRVQRLVLLNRALALLRCAVDPVNCPVAGRRLTRTVTPIRMSRIVLPGSQGGLLRAGTATKEQDDW